MWQRFGEEMREIKFRAWDPGLNQMSEIFGIGGAPSFPTGVPGGYRSCSSKKIYMQFTGLLDKNGKEIYEGDVVKFINTEGKIFIKEVRFNEESLSYCFGDMEYRVIDESAYFTKSKHLEVIGNIYDNPELVK
jgi:YopX protein